MADDVTQTYEVRVTREDEMWLADVDSVPGTHTYGRTLAVLDHNVREAIAVALDLADGAEPGLALSWDIHSGDDELDRRAAEVRKLREGVQRAEQRLQEQTVALACELRGKWPVRDTAVMLGVSAQRVSQINPVQPQKSVA